MKQVFCAIAAFLLVSFTASAQSNSSTSNTYYELVFQNPTLVSGDAGKNGAVYKFSNVATGIDATVKILARSSSAVKLTSIDVSDMGWKKAFQPQFGIPGYVACAQDWWMDFEMRFYTAGTSTKKKLGGFKATAIDVDGDGVSIREYLQMNNVKSVAYSNLNYLAPQAATTTTADDGDATDATDDYNHVGTDKKVLGPTQNYYNIDTLGKPVMATFSYEEKDMITFRYGAKSGNVISNAGERLNSLWFKAFDLTAAAPILPIHFTGFTATYQNKKALLSWTALSDEAVGSFTIERSTDGVSFQPIGQQVAHYGSFAYSFTDDQLSSVSGLVYYRIQSREKSGEVNFSAIKSIRLNKEASTSISVYPNPVRNTANVTLPAAWQNHAVQVTVFNANGSAVQSKLVKSASQTETVDMGQLPEGFYVVKALCNGQWSEQRIIKN